MSEITNQDKRDAANRTFELKFQEIFENDDATPGIADRIAETVPTTSETGEVDFLGAMPVLRKWVGKRLRQAQRAYNHTFALEPYEATWGLKRTKVRYDNIGAIARRISRFFARNRYWKEKILFDELKTNPTGYDGVALYSTAHPHGPSGNQSNTTTAAFGVSTLDLAMQGGASLRDERGESLGISYDLLVVGPKLGKRAREITGSDRLMTFAADGTVDGTSSQVGGANVPNFFIGGMMDLLIWPRLVGDYDDHWHLFDTTSDAKSMLLYEGRDVEGFSKTEMTDDNRWERDEHEWALESDHDPIAGAWQTTYAGIL